MTDPGGQPDAFDLSLQQEQLWSAEPEGPSGRSQVVVELPSGTGAGAVPGALAQVVDRHEVLRTTFARPPGLRLPLQIVHDDLPVDWSGCDGEEVEATATRELTAAIDLTAGPVLRAVLLENRRAGPVLVITASSVTADPPSLTLVAEEVVRLVTGEPLDGEPVQYADYAAWQRDQQPEVVGDRNRELPSIGLPFATLLRPGGLVRRRLPGQAAAALAGLAQAADVSLRDAWLTGWLLLAARLSGESDVAVAVVTDDRPVAELRGAVGPYAVAAAVRAEIGTADSVCRLAQRVAATSGALEDVSASGRPLVLPYGFRWHEAAPMTRGIAGDLVGTQVDLTVSGALVEVTAANEAVADRVIAHLEQLIGQVVHDPDAAAWQVDVLPPAERQRLVGFGTGPVEDVPDVAGVHVLIERQAARTPDAPAVHGSDGAMSYRQLDERANQVAHLLRSLGVSAGTPVAICLDRSTRLLVALLGVLKAGGAYLPLHPEHPGARLAFLLADAGAPVVLTQRSLLAVLPETPAQVLCLDTDEARVNACPRTAPDPVTGPDDIAYLIYTSGTTGGPKGVAVRHGGVVNYTTAIIRRFGLAAQPLRFGLVTTTSTDLGNTSIFPALVSGGCVELVPVEASVDGAAYAEHVRRHPVDVLKITPSHLAALLHGAAGDAVLPRRHLILGGEALPWSLIDMIRARASCTVTNHYGPTEATIGALAHDAGPGTADDRELARTVPIGRPLANTIVRVVDVVGGLTPTGVPGELHIGGAGLARGYWNADELTEQLFPRDARGQRWYRTGDLVRVLPSGTVEFLGRTDDQVKVHGFRVEPGEVEDALRGLPRVRAAAVVADEDERGESRIVAYVVGDVRTPADVEELRRLLGERLPSHLVPAAIVTLEALPLAANGKLDRRSLPRPEEVRLSGPAGSVAPRTDTERRIAGIWAEVMRLDAVSVVDDFFGLGGHSLLATQVIARIRSAFGVQLPLPSLFLAPTVAELAALVEERLAPAPVGDEELAGMLRELEGLSDEEAEELLRREADPPE